MAFNIRSCTCTFTTERNRSFTTFQPSRRQPRGSLKVSGSSQRKPVKEESEERKEEPRRRLVAELQLVGRVAYDNSRSTAWSTRPNTFNEHRCKSFYKTIAFVAQRTEIQSGLKVLEDVSPESGTGQSHKTVKYIHRTESRKTV